MASLYVHIPFCRKACSYCDFYFSLNRDKYENSFTQALLQEILLVKDFFKDLPHQEAKKYAEHGLRSVYVGGGTPSILESENLKRIMAALFRNFKISAHAEISLEVNPEDSTAEKLLLWRSLGFTRLSLGLQAFSEQALVYLGRRHGYLKPMALNSLLKNAQRAGFKNISVDLMYGFASLEDAKWVESLKQVLAFNINHVSAYALSVEPGSLLARQIAHGRRAAVDEAHASRQFLLLRKVLKQQGFLQYEISNFSRNINSFSRHNMSYWQGRPYLGLGPAAHSYDGAKKRFINVSNIHNYARVLSNQKKHSTEIKALKQVEILSTQERFHDFLITRLRNLNGISLTEIEELFFENSGTKKLRKTFFKQVTLLEKEKLLYVYRGRRLRLTEKGLLFSDYIIRSFFIEKQDLVQQKTKN